MNEMILETGGCEGGRVVLNKEGKRGIRLGRMGTGYGRRQYATEMQNILRKMCEETIQIYQSLLDSPILSQERIQSISIYLQLLLFLLRKMTFGDWTRRCTPLPKDA